MADMVDAVSEAYRIWMKLPPSANTHVASYLERFGYSAVRHVADALTPENTGLTEEQLAPVRSVLDKAHVTHHLAVVRDVQPGPRMK